MGRIYNRTPIQINTPSSNKVLQFTYSDFKGINENKNFITVEQESFADCKNVFVNEYGILSSRPHLIPIKNVTDVILDFWSFGKIIIYKVKDGDFYKLHIVDDDISLYLDIFNENVTIVEMDNKLIIFCKFEDEYIKYYDKVKKVINSADELLYIPNITARSELLTDDVDSKNVLTSKTIETFLYTPETGLSPNIYSYLSIKYKIETPISENFVTIDTTYPSLTERLLDFAFLFGKGTILSSPANQLVYIDEINKKVMYSPDGLTFSKTYTWNFKNIISYGFINVSNDENAGYNFLICLELEDSTKKTYRLDSYGEIYYNKSIIEKPVSGPLLNIYDDSEVYLKETSLNDYKYQFYAKYNFGSNVTHIAVGNTTLEPLALICAQGEEIVIDGSWKSGVSFITLFETRCTLDWVYDFSSSTRYDLPFKTRYCIPVSGKLLGFTSNLAVYYDESNLKMYIVKTKESTLTNEKLTYELIESIMSIKTTDDTIWSVGDDLLMFSNCIIDDEFWECGVYEYNGNMYPIVLPDYDGKITTLTVGKNLFVAKQKDTYNDVPVYRSGLNKTIELQAITDGKQQELVSKFTSVTTLNEHYFAIDNILYITEYREEDDDFKLYVPEKSKQSFNSKILAMAPISESIVAIFTENDVWYVENSENGYRYYRSRLVLSLFEGLNVITDSSGTNTLLCDRNGLLLLSYQAFTATSEQGLSYLSSPIHSRFDKGKINKILVYKNWIICYEYKSPDVYLLDTRNSSWWYFNFNIDIDKIVVLTNDDWDNELSILSNGKLYKLTYDDKYKDDINGESLDIDWFIKSQKLHFNAINNHKHIENLIFYSVENGDIATDVNLSIRNYRDYVNVGKDESFDYNVDIIKTFVKKLNYFNVNEFEYILKSNSELSIQNPLSLSNISIKYRLGNEVK